MGSIFKPKINKVKPPAPQVDIPTPEPVEPELGRTDDTPKKKKGKSALKIDLANTSGSGSGVNIV
jgi:hypothetical protein